MRQVVADGCWWCRRHSEQVGYGSGCVGRADPSEKRSEWVEWVSFWPQIGPILPPSKRATKHQKRVPRMSKARSLEAISARQNVRPFKYGTCHILVNGDQ